MTTSVPLHRVNNSSKEILVSTYTGNVRNLQEEICYTDSATLNCARTIYSTKALRKVLRPEKLHSTCGFAGYTNLTLSLGSQIAHDNRHVDSALTFHQGFRNQESAVHMTGIGDPGGATTIEGFQLPETFYIFECAADTLPFHLFISSNGSDPNFRAQAD